MDLLDEALLGGSDGQFDGDVNHGAEALPAPAEDYLRSLVVLGLIDEAPRLLDTLIDFLLFHGRKQQAQVHR